MIVGIIGLKRSGKDTVADVLCDHFGFIKYSFAKPLKEATKAIFGFSDYQVYGDGKDKVDHRIGMTPRKVLQVVGTELFQYNIYDHLPELEEKVPKRQLWVWKFKDFVLSHSGFDIVVSDMRFRHEALAISQMNGNIIKIVRKGLVPELHKSEAEVEEIVPDFVIMNDSGVEELKEKARKLFISEYGLREFSGDFMLSANLT